jgi:hypothetical protein
MHAAASAAQNLDAIKVFAVLSAIILVKFWREVVKLAIVALATAVVVLLGVGAFTLLGGVHH